MRRWMSYADGMRIIVAAVRGSRRCSSREGKVLLLVNCMYDWVALLREALGSWHSKHMNSTCNEYSKRSTYRSTRNNFQAPCKIGQGCSGKWTSGSVITI